MTKARRLYAATFLLALLVALATKHSAVTGTEVARAGGAPTVAALQASGSIDVPDDLTFASKYLAPDEKLRLAGKSNGVSWYLANGRYGETCLLAARDADAADGMSCWVKDDLERGRMWSALQLDAERWEVAVLLPDGYSIRA